MLILLVNNTVANMPQDMPLVPTYWRTSCQRGML